MNNHDLAWVRGTTKEQRLEELISMMNRFASAFEEDAERHLHLAEGYDTDMEDEELEDKERRLCAYEAGKERQKSTDLRYRADELRHLAELLATCK